MVGRLLLIASLALVGSALVAPAASAGGGGLPGGAQGVSLPGSPHRYVAVSPRLETPLTVVERIAVDGGTIDRWWYLRGNYFVPAVAYDGSGGGLSADGRTLVLARFTRAYPPRTTSFAVLDTAVHLSHPRRSGEHRPQHAVTRFRLRGTFGFDAISPDGSRIYLTHLLAPRSPYVVYEVRAFDVASGRLLPEPIVDPEEPAEKMQGLPVSRATSRDGRWAYTLYDGAGGEPFLHALDTVRGRAVCVDLPQLADRREPFALRLRLEEDGHRLTVLGPRGRGGPVRPLAEIDTESFAISQPQPVATTSSRPGLPWLWLGVVAAVLGLTGDDPAPARTAAGPTPADSRLVAFTQTPRRPGNLLGRYDVLARSAGGRPIELRQIGDPAIDGELLVFGCVHGDECGASRIQPLTNGCPDPHADIYLVPNLDPDGAARGSRLNGRGVDLNRNFGAGWRPIGRRWSPQYSGPRPFSEPETRLAARIVRGVGPEATIWFHQYGGRRPFVRAWGQSTPVARRFARLARMPFRLMSWPAGTGPNWQNHRFPGIASFVVELPRGKLGPRMRSRVAKATLRLGRWVGED